MAQISRELSMSTLETMSIGGQSTTTTGSEMHLKDNVRSLYERVQNCLRHGRRKEKRDLEISAPFNTKLMPVCIPGISVEEISLLREKAAASRIGVAETRPQPPSLTLDIPRRARSPYSRSASPHSALSAQQTPTW